MMRKHADRSYELNNDFVPLAFCLAQLDTRKQNERFYRTDYFRTSKMRPSGEPEYVPEQPQRLLETLLRADGVCRFITGLCYDWSHYMVKSDANDYVDIVLRPITDCEKRCYWQPREYRRSYHQNFPLGGYLLKSSKEMTSAARNAREPGGWVDAIRFVRTHGWEEQTLLMAALS